MSKLPQKKILDACCGGKMFWFDKNDKRVLFTDIRKEEKGFIKHRLSYEVNPDKIMDFRKMDFPDNSFKLVVFYPPHLQKLGKTIWMGKKYGILGENWKEDLQQGFKECFRVLEKNGILIFKWGERDVKISEVLKLTDEKPLFGHTTSAGGHTKWITFMK